MSPQLQEFTPRFSALRTAIISLLVLCAAWSNAGAATVEVSADIIGTARDAGRDGSFESLPFSDAVFMQRQAIGNFADRGLFEFDLSDLPDGNILSITLQLIVISTTLDRTNYDLYSYAGNGIIETSDATAGSSFATDLDGNVISQTTPVLLDVTSLFMQPNIQTAGYAGFMVRYPVEDSGGTIQKQLGTPLLLVEVIPVPLPAAAWLFMSALGVLGWRHRNVGHQ